VANVAESVGGQLESFHFALGDRDAYVIVDLPDHESAAAVALTVNAAGGDQLFWGSTSRRVCRGSC
jgi:uncharacterized protein with GYD domain